MGSSNTEIPFVSFCMSTFNRPVFLKQQLQTILNQSFQNFEVVICDNDPEGSAQDVVNFNGDSRLRYYRNITNIGMIKSFNRSIELSKGQFVVMITDDDPVYPDMLETLVNLYDIHPGYGMYLGGCDLFCTHHEVAKLYGLKVGTNSCLSSEFDLNYIKVFKPYEFVRDLFLFKIFPHYLWSTGMVNREVLLQRGGVPDYGTPFLGDYAYLGIMGTHSGCVIINKSLGCQTIHNENFGRNQNEQLPLLVSDFSNYIGEKLSYMPEWPEINKLSLHFVAIWVTGHLAFLHRYKKINKNYNRKSLLLAEKVIFKNEFMHSYRVKYLLKKNAPLIHDFIVKLKKRLAGKYFTS